MLERHFGERDDRNVLLNLGVVVEGRPCRQVGAFDSPQLLLLGAVRNWMNFQAASGSFALELI